MRKVLSFVLTVLMLFTALGTVNIFAAENNGDSGLVIHWDFSGDTLEEQLANKAADGSAADSLKLFTKGKSSVADGKMTLSHDAGEYMQFLVDTGKGIGNNLVAAGNNTTFYIRYKLSGKASNTYTPFVLNHKYAKSFMTRGYHWADGHLVVRFDNKEKLNVKDYQVNDNEFCTVAVTFNKDAQNNLTLVEYLSKDGKNFQSVQSSIKTHNSSFWGEKSDILFGKMYNQLETSLGKTVVYDDIRVYNKALTKQEIESISDENTSVSYKGVQQTSVEGGKFSARFISSVYGLNYEKVGYSITLKGETNKTVEKLTANVCKNLNANQNGKMESIAYKNENVFIVALTVESIPATGTYTFDVIPVAYKNTAEKICGNGFTVVFTDGVLVSQTPIIK